MTDTTNQEPTELTPLIKVVSKLTIMQDQIKGNFVNLIAQLDSELTAVRKENNLLKSKIPNWKELIS